MRIPERMRPPPTLLSRRSMPRLPWRRWLPAVLTVVLLTAGVAGAEATKDASARPAPITGPRPIVPVVGAQAVCPDAVTTPASTTRITAGVGGSGEVRVSAAELDPAATAQVLTDVGGRIGDFTGGRPDTGAVVATATGPLAGGLAAEQITRAEAGTQFGLASVRCEPAIADSWYVGAATTITDRSELFVTNPYDDAATVDVTIYNRKGPLDIPGTKGVAVRPRTRIVKALADWAPDQTWLAINVVVRSGRVSPAVRRTRSVSSVANGVDWVPRVAPGDAVTVGGLPGGPGERTLLLFNPGEDTVVADVSVTRQDGQFTPIDLVKIEVESKKLVAVPITDDLEDLAAMLQVDTDGAPLLAAAYATYEKTATAGARDFVFAASTPALHGPALLTDNRVGPDVETTLMFSAPDGDAEVTLTQLAADGVEHKTSLVPVRQGQLVSVALSQAFGNGDPLPLLITTSANSAGVYATRVIVEKTKRGTLVTALGVQSQPIAGVRVPSVVSDPAGWLVARR